jgi:hypothetical protein
MGRDYPPPTAWSRTSPTPEARKMIASISAIVERRYAFDDAVAAA